MDPGRRSREMRTAGLCRSRPWKNEWSANRGRRKSSSGPSAATTPTEFRGQPERVRIEETKEPDGTIRSSSTVSRGDINGSFQLAERSTKVTRTVGNRVESSTAIERPTLNGSMDLVEKNEQTVVTSGPKTSENVTVFRRDPNGRMAEFAKKTREAVSQRWSGSRECRGV